MVKILFVCLGNICRSPMAEFLMKYKLKSLNLEAEVYSKGTSDEEEGNPVYYMTATLLDRLNIDYSTKRAEQMTYKDGDYYDYIIGMEQRNVNNAVRIIGQKNAHKVFRLMDFTDEPKDIADPWYTRNFSITYEQISKGLDGLIQYLKIKGLI